ncbi:hypothetical protein Hdeb2414_s0019g00544861 [Helianthus debilis subsp. tardiflorus]
MNSFRFSFSGYLETVVVILHEKELTWVGRLSYKQHTCVISALSISTTLKQHQLIWSPTVNSKVITKSRTMRLYGKSSGISTAVLLCPSESFNFDSRARGTKL